MAMDTAHASYWQISEVVFGVPLLLGIGLQWAAPLGIPPGPLRVALIPVGAALFIAGAVLAIAARREFARHSQSMEPKRSITSMVETGVFSFSRNPLYLGIAVGLAGIALAFNNLWILVMLIPAVIACHYVLIAPEERYLRLKFGNEYLEYAGSRAALVGARVSRASAHRPLCCGAARMKTPPNGGVFITYGQTHAHRSVSADWGCRGSGDSLLPTQTRKGSEPY